MGAQQGFLSRTGCAPIRRARCQSAGLLASKSGLAPLCVGCSHSIGTAILMEGARRCYAADDDIPSHGAYRPMRPSREL
jgi:hypothetical protein